MKKMKAALCKRYGAPEVLQIQEVNMPVCRDHELLVSIRATAVNSGDVKLRSLSGNGFVKLLMRLALGIFRPRQPILGTVYAGIVVDKGKNASKFTIGEKVFGITGFKFGTYAAYTCVKENSVISQMPEQASFEEAASLPFGWHTAIYFLRKAGIEKRIQPKVLIYGATGSVGVAAVQWVRNFDAELTAVCSKDGKPLMHRMGINKVMAYDLEDFTQTTDQFDIIFDAVGKTSKAACKKMLHKGGSYVTVNGFDMATERITHLQLVGHLFDTGKCRAIIDRVYTLSEIAAAHTYVEQGRKKGDVIVTIC